VAQTHPPDYALTHIAWAVYHSKRWIYMPNDLHTHNFTGITTLNDGHTHRYSGITGSAPNVPGHTHAMMGTTTVNDRHSHNYNLQTSQSMQAMRGHTHSYQAFTSFADRHNHFMSGNTSVYMDPAIPAQLQPGLFGPSASPVPPGQFRFGRPERRVCRPDHSRPLGRACRVLSPYLPGKVPEARRDSRRRHLSPRSRGRRRSPSTRCGFSLQIQIFLYLAEKRTIVWAWVIFVGRRSFAGFRWTGSRWVLFRYGFA
jgi:hypothetical protein